MGRRSRKPEWRIRRCNVGVNACGRSKRPWVQRLKMQYALSHPKLCRPRPPHTHNSKVAEKRDLAEMERGREKERGQ